MSLVGDPCWCVCLHMGVHVLLRAFPPLDLQGWSQSPLPSVGRGRELPALLPKRSVGAWLVGPCNGLGRAVGAHAGPWGWLGPGRGHAEPGARGSPAR